MAAVLNEIPMASWRFFSPVAKSNWDSFNEDLPLGSIVSHFVSVATFLSGNTDERCPRIWQGFRSAPCRCLEKLTVHRAEF
jgi:hypothetical protein